MYLEHFGLTTSPFGISPRLDFLYKSGAFEESMAHLVYGLDNSEAIVMITGAIGTGKTMAIQSFLSYLGDRYHTALITNTCVDGKELLKLILDDLGSPAAVGSDKSDLLIAFKKIIIDAKTQGRRIVVVIDEAQNLGRDVLEEIRQLTNLGQGEEQPVQVILVGQPELEATVLRPELAQLRQRIRVHYKLDPLSRRELEEYVDHRMQVAGRKTGAFAGAALDRIFALSGGVPRVVNTLCGDALLSAFVAGRHKVEARDLDEQDEPAAGPAAQPVSAPVPATADAARMAPAPTEEPRPAMASRREPQLQPARREPTSRSRAAAPDIGGRAGRRRGLAIAAVVIAAVVVALFATGQLVPLWSRLPFAGTQAASVDLPIGHDLQGAGGGPSIEASPEQAAGAVDPVPVAAVDSSAAAVDSSRIEQKPAPRVEQKPVLAAAVVASDIPADPSAETAGATALDGQFFLHVSSFRTADHAESVASELTGSGVPATVGSQLVRGDLWYRVYLGPFVSHDEAVQWANRLRDEGRITYYKVVRRGSGEGS